MSKINPEKSGKESIGDHEGPGRDTTRSNSSSFQTRSWTILDSSARDRTSSTTHTVLPKTNDQTNAAPAFELVTLSNFDKFQRRIFGIVHGLAHQPKYKHHQFCIDWTNAEKHQHHTFDENTSFRTIAKIFPHVKDLQAYRRFLHSCPTLNKIFITRDAPGHQKGFEYRLLTVNLSPTKQPQKVTETSSAASSVTTLNPVPRTVEHPTVIIDPVDEDGYHSCTGTKQDFSALMHQVWMIMDSYSKANPMDASSKLWISWLHDGLTANSDFQQVKQIMSLDGLDQFYFYLQDCSPITTILDLKWDNKILFRTALLDTPVASTKDPSDLSVEANSPEPTKDHMPDVIPTTPYNPVPEPTDFDLMPPIRNYYAITLADLTTTQRFCVLHSLMYDTMHAWSLAKENGDHPFMDKWYTLLAKGLNRYQNFTDIQIIMQITTLEDYITTISECPDILENFDWTWTPTEFRYWYADKPFHIDLAQIENLRNDLTDFQSHYESTIQDARRQLIEITSMITRLDQRVSRNIENYETKLNDSLAKHDSAIKSAFDTHYADATKNLREYMTTLRENFTNMTTTKTAEYQQSMLDHCEVMKTTLATTANTITEQVIHQIETAASSAYAKIKQQFGATVMATPVDSSAPASKLPTAAERIDIRSPHSEPNYAPPADVAPVTHLAHQPQTTSSTSLPSIPATASSRWPHVDPAFIKKMEDYTPPPPPANFTPISGRNDTHNTELTLPSLQYDMVMKRLSVQYMGQGDILVFYNQLLNGIHPYGCYLKKVADITVDCSLCPEYWNGVLITDSRYIEMAGCLYQKLASVDVIPLEYTHARNIVNRFAEANDGYKVLYALLEPLLTRETTSIPPLVKDCSDVHEYSLKVQSYFNCETLAGRIYRQREQVNVFLNGLESDPQYWPAIKRARTLLDTSELSNPTVPAVLKPSILPNTISRYMREETGQPTIRAMYHNGDQKPRRDRNETRSSPSKPGKTPLDHSKICNVCHLTGHTYHNCLPYGKFLMFREAEQQTDTVRRQKIIESYKAHIKQKQEIRQKRQQLGTIRQMIQEGGSYEELESALLQTMPELRDTSLYSSSDESDSE